MDMALTEPLGYGVLSDAFLWWSHLMVGAPVRER